MIPDWSGEVCAIIASGPSAKQANIDALRGRAKVLAIKENVELCPWADAVYGCDGAWWQHRSGLPKFTGQKFAWDRHVCDRYPDLIRVRIEDKKCDLLLTHEPLSIGSGGNSGFQALNLAVQFGTRRIILVGFDMTDRPGAHWYGRNLWAGANNPTEDNFRRWRAAFAAAEPVFKDIGCDVVNVSPFSELKCFRRSTIESALLEWNA